MSGAVDRLVPSVDEATLRYANTLAIWLSPWHGPNCHQCYGIEQRIENAALALDMALAQESDARRAEADRLRAEVAW